MPANEFPAQLINIIRNAEHISVLTGSGVSAASGVPTFRDAQTGLWAQYRPEELATPEAFQRDPKLVWQWYAMRRELIRQAEPNAAHRALAQMQQHVPRLTLITQNVDNLHQQAGSRDVIELHGNLARTKCFDNEHIVSAWNDEETPPRCPLCRSLLRPDVVWFGEQLPVHALQQAIEAASHCDLFFSIGTSALVYPAAALPREAERKGIPIVEINPDETPLTGAANFALQASAADVLPELVQMVWNVESG